MKRGFTKWELIIAVAGLGLLGAIMFPVFYQARDRKRGKGTYGCSNNLKNIGLGVKQYTQDYDGKYPIVISGGAVYGWADAIQPYVKSTQIYQCPSEVNPSQSNENPRARNYTDYWMNARIAGQPERSFKEQANTLMVGDGNDSLDVTDARYSLRSIPTAWIGNNASPLHRHYDRSNYAFADGHVKSLTAAEVEAMNPDSSPAHATPTFTVK